MKINWLTENQVGWSIFRTQFDVVFDSESNGSIFDFLAQCSGELWRLENLEFLQNLQPTPKFFLRIFMS